MSDPAGDRFETVAYVYGQPQLALLLSLFEDAHIWVVPVGYGHASVQWNWTLALGGVALKVHESDVEAARELLEGLDPTPVLRPVFSENRFLEIVLILGLFLIGFFAPPARLPAHFVLDRRVAPARQD